MVFNVKNLYTNRPYRTVQTGPDETVPEGAAWSRSYKKVLCSNQLCMKFFLFINVKMPTTVGILEFCMPSGPDNGL